jgi:hypothetical protein
MEYPELSLWAFRMRNPPGFPEMVHEIIPHRLRGGDPAGDERKYNG